MDCMTPGGSPCGLRRDHSDVATSRRPLRAPGGLGVGHPVPRTPSRAFAGSARPRWAPPRPAGSERPDPDPGGRRLDLRSPLRSSAALRSSGIAAARPPGSGVAGGADAAGLSGVAEPIVAPVSGRARGGTSGTGARARRGETRATRVPWPCQDGSFLTQQRWVGHRGPGSRMTHAGALAHGDVDMLRVRHEQ